MIFLSDVPRFSHNWQINRGHDSKSNKKTLGFD